MKLKQFENEIVSEISMVEVAKALLEARGEVMGFQEIIEEVSKFIEIDETEMKKRRAQFYTDVNVDGEFISLGDNTWGLRSWFPLDSINEVLTHENDEEDIIPYISEDGFDDYDKAALEEDFKDEEEPVEDDYDEESDAEEEDLSEFQEDIDELDADAEDTNLEGLEIADDEDLLDDEEDDL